MTEFWGSLHTNNAFAADATHLFALTSQAGQFNAVKRAKSGGAVAQIGQLPAGSSQLIAVDATHMWLSVTQLPTAKLYKLAK
ncbi:MAG: hypothetical protein IPI67_34445 [Myxococcales bacterium]|nr:hypothetical protein [Myxococcales bacterium]